MVEVLAWFVANRTRREEYLSIVPANTAHGQGLDKPQSSNSDSPERGLADWHPIKAAVGLPGPGSITCAALRPAIRARLKPTKRSSDTPHMRLI